MVCFSAMVELILCLPVMVAPDGVPDHLSMTWLLVQYHPLPAVARCASEVCWHGELIDQHGMCRCHLDALCVCVCVCVCVYDALC